METTIVYWGNIGIMEKKMETTIAYWGNIGIMEKKMETTICKESSLQSHFLSSSLAGLGALSGTNLVP